jgi:hypothetical protein
MVMLGGLAAASAAMGRTVTSPAHWLAGGFSGTVPVTRTRIGSVSTGKIGTTQAIALPQPHLLYMMPHTAAVKVFQESQDVTVNSLGQITINTAGLWRVTACADWPGRYGYDINNRKLTIWRAPVGVAPPAYNGGALTQYVDNNTSDRLASHDAPASDVPQYLRTSTPWPAKQGLGAGQYQVLRVNLPTGGPVSINPGDFVNVSIDSLTDTNLGSTTIDEVLRLEARVVGPNLVMVTLTNTGTTSVNVPAGNLYVVAATSSATTGNSADAWTMLSSSDEYLLAGESVFVTWASETPGDWIQVTNMTYVQLELLKTPA